MHKLSEFYADPAVMLRDIRRGMITRKSIVPPGSDMLDTRKQHVLSARNLSRIEGRKQDS